MLAPAVFHGDRLRSSFARRTLEDRNSHYFFDSYVTYAFDIDATEAKRFQYVSVHRGVVLAYFEARVDRMHFLVEDLLITRIEERVSKEGVLDFFSFLKLLFDQQFRKVVYRVVAENPALSMYQKHMVEHLRLSRFVGTLRAHRKLPDQHYHDILIFEIDQEAFSECLRRHPDLFRGTSK